MDKDIKKYLLLGAILSMLTSIGTNINSININAKRIHTNRVTRIHHNHRYAHKYNIRQFNQKMYNKGYRDERHDNGENHLISNLIKNRHVFNKSYVNGASLGLLRNAGWRSKSSMKKNHINLYTYSGSYVIAVKKYLRHSRNKLFRRGWNDNNNDSGWNNYAKRHHLRLHNDGNGDEYASVYTASRGLYHFDQDGNLDLDYYTNNNYKNGWTLADTESGDYSQRKALSDYKKTVKVEKGDVAFLRSNNYMFKRGFLWNRMATDPEYKYYRNKNYQKGYMIEHRLSKSQYINEAINQN